MPGGRVAEFRPVIVFIHEEDVRCGEATLPTSAQVHRHTQALVQLRVGCGVLKADLFATVQTLGDGKSSQRTLMKAAQDELLLARINVDVTDREDAGDIGLKLLRIDLDAVLRQVQSPLGDGPELRVQPPEGQEVLHRNGANAAVLRLDLDGRERIVVFNEANDAALKKLHLHFAAVVAHALHRRRSGLEITAAVDEHHTVGARQQVQGPVERRVTTTQNDDVLAVMNGLVANAVKHLPAFVFLEAGHVELARREGTNTRRNDHCATIKSGAGGRYDPEPTVFEWCNLVDLLSQMKRGRERADLLLKTVDQLFGAANRQRRNIVDGLVRVQLDTLPTSIVQRIDEVRLQAQQTELKDLKESAGTSAHDNDISLDFHEQDQREERGFPRQVCANKGGSKYIPEQISQECVL